MKNFKKLLFLLTPREQKKAGLLLIYIIAMSLIEMLGIASILPFMIILSDPGMLDTNSYLQSFFDLSRSFGIKNVQEFLFFLGFLVFFLLVTSLALKVFISYKQIYFVNMTQYSLSKRLLEGYLYHPYEWFLNQHSGDLGKNILSEVGNVVGNGMKAMIEFISKTLIVILIIILLLVSNPKLTLIIFCVFILSYAIIFFYFRLKLNKIGEHRLLKNKIRYETIGETFSAIKEIKVRGSEQDSLLNFANAAKSFANAQAQAQIISQIPRFILEGIVFGGVILMILFLIGQTGSLINALPILSLFVFSGYRLMPALQAIYVTLTQLIYIGPALNKLFSDLKNTKSNIIIKNKDIIKVKKSINLKNISYTYPNGSNEILKNINFNIPIGSKIGFIGTTGSGKTTAADIILGLLNLKKGTLEVDEKVITKPMLRSWQNSIGYVPQNIFLSDDTVASNIAFGTNSKFINKESVIHAAKVAQIHEFVINKLPEQYQTFIGERGIRLSGGQRQRIGIARALYQNPQILILDEATSALDNHTEKLLMNEIYNLNKDQIIIIIAHRLNTIENCDFVYKFENGKIISMKN